jgi:hypothetical protein
MAVLNRAEIADSLSVAERTKFIDHGKAEFSRPDVCAR